MREEVEKILAKGYFEETDINILVKNQSILTQEELVKLGFTQVPVVQETPVVVEKPVVKAVKAVKKTTKKIIK